MFRFQVFLPPTLVPLETIKTAPPAELVFYNLPRPVRHNPASQSLPQRILGATQEEPDQDLPRPTAEVSDGDTSAGVKRAPEEESWEKSVLDNGDKRIKLDHIAPPAIPAWGKSKHNVEASRTLGPRRSARFARTSDGFLTIMPALDTTESFFSLNTTATITQSSQPALPSWTISLSKLNSLHVLLASRTRRGGHESSKVSLMVCVMAVDTPVLRQRKEEKARGQEGTLWIGGWRVTAPPVEGSKGSGEVSCTVKLWEGLAREWGDGKVRRGDVVLLEDVEYRSANTKEPACLTISTSPSGPQPRITILYRTLPRRASPTDYLPSRNPHQLRNFHEEGRACRSSAFIAEDALLRPDLTLGRSDPGVRRVAEWARWFAEWVGGEMP